MNTEHQSYRKHLDLKGERELHRRLLAQEEDAPRDALTAYLERLILALRGRFPQRPGEMELEDQASLALERYILQPGRYRDTEKGVFQFLLMDVTGDVLNLLRRKSPILQSELPPEVDWVAEDEPDRKIWMEVLGDVEGLPPEITLDELWRRVRTVLPAPDDQAFLRVWLDGEAGYRAFVPLLGLENRTETEQQSEVSRVRDRIRMALKRIGRGFQHG